MYRFKPRRKLGISILKKTGRREKNVILRQKDYVPNNIGANNIKTKLVSFNIKNNIVSNNMKILG